MPIEVVLDASAAAKVLRREPETDAFEKWLMDARARRVRLIVPEVFAYEVRNVAAKAFAAGELPDAAMAAEACENVLSMTAMKGTPVEANIAMAASLTLTAQDAAYVLLATAGRALVTYDAKMAKAANSTKGCGQVIAPS